MTLLCVERDVVNLDALHSVLATCLSAVVSDAAAVKIITTLNEIATSQRPVVELIFGSTLCRTVIHTERDRQRRQARSTIEIIQCHTS